MSRRFFIVFALLAVVLLLKMVAQEVTITKVEPTEVGQPCVREKGTE